MQYNYSHNNEGGFMLIMNGFPHTRPIIRYNISQNDNDKHLSFLEGFRLELLYIIMLFILKNIRW